MKYLKSLLMDRIYRVNQKFPLNGYSTSSPCKKSQKVQRRVELSAHPDLTEGAHRTEGRHYVIGPTVLHKAALQKC